MSKQIILNALRLQLTCIESEISSLYRDLATVKSMIRANMIHAKAKNKTANRISHLNRRKARIVATIKEIKHA